MFPVTDDSATVVDCLMRAAGRAGARLLTGSGVKRGLGKVPGRTPAAASLVELSAGGAGARRPRPHRHGGRPGSAGLSIAASLGHSVAPPVPSLFTFHVDDPRLKGLEGVCAPARPAPRSGAGACASPAPSS